jgi:hypothetical protein
MRITHVAVEGCGRFGSLTATDATVVKGSMLNRIGPFLF